MSSMGLNAAAIVQERACLLVRPLLDRIHVQPLPEALSDVIDVQRAALEFKSGYRTHIRITRGLVVETGPDVKEVLPGQVVRFSDTCAREMNTDEEREYLIRETDVLEADDRLIGDIVLVDPTVPESQKGLVVLPSFRPKEPECGTVIEIGPGKLLKNGQRIPMEIAIGERVLFPKFFGQEVIKHGKAYLALRYSELNGVLNGIRDVQI